MTRALKHALAVAAVASAATVPALLGGVGHSHEDEFHAWAEDTVFTVTEVRPGVHFAVGRQGQAVGANSVFIVTDRDVILVDDHITPRAARALLAEIRRVTDRPLRYVVNTHHHYDHTSGNGIFGPDVEILSHPATRARLIATGQQSIRRQLEAWQRAIVTARARRDTTGSDSVRQALDRQIATWEQLVDDYRDLTVALPTATVDSSLVFFRAGGQEIRVFYLGRAHTEGDVVVQLPREGLMLAGDMITNTAGPPNMMDAYAGEWGATLRRLARLEFTTTLPGHGQPFDGRERYAATADLMDDVWRQVSALAAAGVPREQVASRLDLGRHTGAFPALSGGLSPVFAGRAWDLARGRAN